MNGRTLRASSALLRDGGLVLGTIYLINMALAKCGLEWRIRRFKERSIQTGGLKFHLRTWDGLLSVSPYHEDVIDKEIAAALGAFNGPTDGKVLINVGAHIGVHFVRHLSAVSRGYAFEPTPESFSILRNNVQSNGLGGKAILMQTCVGKESGSAWLLQRSAESQNSVTFSPNHRGGNGIPVEAVRLDDVIEEADRTNVALILIDVEGAELSVLEGAAEIISASQPIIIVEILDDDARNKCSRYLGGLGYSGKAIDQTNWKFVAVAS